MRGKGAKHASVHAQLTADAGGRADAGEPQVRSDEIKGRGNARKRSGSVIALVDAAYAEECDAYGDTAVGHGADVFGLVTREHEDTDGADNVIDHGEDFQIVDS